MTTKRKKPTIQYPNNQIERGYKKGSKILFIVCCEPQEARERETRIKIELKKKFQNQLNILLVIIKK